MTWLSPGLVGALVGNRGDQSVELLDKQNHSHNFRRFTADIAVGDFPRRGRRSGPGVGDVTWVNRDNLEGLFTFGEFAFGDHQGRALDSTTQ